MPAALEILQEPVSGDRKSVIDINFWVANIERTFNELHCKITGNFLRAFIKRFRDCFALHSVEVIQSRKTTGIVRTETLDAHDTSSEYHHGNQASWANDKRLGTKFIEVDGFRL